MNGLVRSLRERLGVQEVMFLDSLEELRKVLACPNPRPQTACLVISDQDELLEIMELRHLMESLRLALVVPDDGDQTLRLAHRLRPRYLTAGKEFSDLAAVLERMAGSGAILQEGII
jgi:hypothetical protein